MEFNLNSDFINFIKTLNNLLNKLLENNNSKKRTFFKNSFIIEVQPNNFKVSNSILDYLRCFKTEDILLQKIISIFKSFYIKCPDLSNYFFRFLLQFLSLVENKAMKENLAKELNCYLSNIIVTVENILTEKVYIIFLPYNNHNYINK